MKKLERRAIICLTMVAVLIAGTILFIIRFVNDGAKWATFYGNKSVYQNGILKSGDIYDVNGELLARNSEGGVIYNDDPDIRRATVHTVGDPEGNIGTSAMNAYRDKLIGYNHLTGTYKLSGKNENITLTIDADVCKAAYQELSQYDAGCIGIYNYKTGEIVCMVSTPSFDPAAEDGAGEEDKGIYINRFLSSKFPPGSIFKAVTAGVVLETEGPREDFTYACDGVRYIGNEKIHCLVPHGVVNFSEAFGLSCNGAFSVLADDVGADNMKKYTEKFGLTKSYDIDGIKNIPGSFEFPDNELNLGWAGVGQYKDEVNPCSMMVYMGAVANGGKAAEPSLLHKKIQAPKMTELMSSKSSEYLSSMMKKAVVDQYGESRFPGLDIYGKTGTAETSGKAPYGWFSGFIKNENAPYAFVVCLENSGEALNTALPVASRVLQSAVAESDK